MKRVRVFDEALRDLDAAVEYYETRREGLGLALLADFEATVEGVRVGLLPGSPVTGQSSRHRLLRVKLRRFPYKLILALLPTELAVVAVAHRRQDEYWDSRLAKTTR